MEQGTVPAEQGTPSQVYAASIIEAYDARKKFSEASSDFKKVEEAEIDTFRSVSMRLLGLPELRDDSREELVNVLKDLNTSDRLTFMGFSFRLFADFAEKVGYAKRSVDSLDRANATAFRLAEEHYSSLTRIAPRKATVVTQATTILDHEDDPSWKAAAGINYQLGKLRNWANTKEQLNKYIAEMELQRDRLLRCWLDIQRLQESAGEDGFDLDASTTAVRDRFRDQEMLLAH